MDDESLVDLEELYVWLQQFEDPTIGDITQKGYEKKRARLLAPYAPKQPQAGGSSSRQQPRQRRTQRRLTHNEKRYHSGGGSGSVGGGRHHHQLPPGGGTSGGGSSSPATRARRRGNRRLTRTETRYHSEVRQEAVQQALAAMQNRPKPSLPMPSKRTSVMARTHQCQTKTSTVCACLALFSLPMKQLGINESPHTKPVA
ncbi:hypothetical protein LSTR_LSTR013676 [Laodelphax striatellus]|uniref:DMAP1-binding domain-containing protein n=1 Tax=Laodelphax striatellus TaxID=195883 RepID=A0A482XPS7_LAOST|nr:hypothetical protein LSTR_LSTR013676 [Laodelphax striatellus]